MKKQNYLVIFHDGKMEQAKRFEAESAGSAFALCLKQYPKCTLIQAIAGGNETRGRSLYGEIRYDPPPVQRIPRQRKRGKKDDSWLIPPV